MDSIMEQNVVMIASVCIWSGGSLRDFNVLPHFDGGFSRPRKAKNGSRSLLSALVTQIP